MARASEKINWQTAFALRSDLVQADIYAFENGLRVFDGRSPSMDTLIERTLKVLSAMGFSAYQSIEAEHYLKAAIRAGWIEQPENQIAEISANGTGRKSTEYILDGISVDKMHPGKVLWYGGAGI